MQLKDKFYCHLSVIPVRAEHQDEAEIVTQLLFGETGEIIEVHNQWRKIRISHDGYEGWIDYKQGRTIDLEAYTLQNNSSNRIFDLTLSVSSPWGPCHLVRGAKFSEKSGIFRIGNDEFTILSGTRQRTPKDIGTMAMSYLNAPYLWGGRTPFGIDCSGFTQAVMHQLGIHIHRDASQQVKQGLEVDFDDAQIGDLVFFVNSKGNIHHVGILLEDHKIIHASGRVRIDILKPEGIEKAETKTISHNFHSIRRFIH